jgi:hypothetical protein
MRFGRSAPARRSTSTPGSCSPTTCTVCLWTPVRARGRLLPEGDADSPAAGAQSSKGFQNPYESVSLDHRSCDSPGRTRYLAAAILGAHDPRRPGLRGGFGLHSFQSGEARSGRASGAVAAFFLSSLYCRRAVPGGMDVHRRRATGDG